VIWQELSEAFMQVGDSVSLETSPEDFTDVRELFEMNTNKGTGPLPVVPEVGEPGDDTTAGDTTAGDAAAGDAAAGDAAAGDAAAGAGSPSFELDPEAVRESGAVPVVGAAPAVGGRPAQALDLAPLFDPGRGKPRA
jgi:hypothetical protein